VHKLDKQDFEQARSSNSLGWRPQGDPKPLPASLLTVQGYVTCLCGGHSGRLQTELCSAALSPGESFAGL